MTSCADIDANQADRDQQVIRPRGQFPLVALIQSLEAHSGVFELDIMPHIYTLTCLRSFARLRLVMEQEGNKHMSDCHR